MPPLSKQDILSAVDIVTEDIAVPEWKGEVRIRSITAAERDAYENAQMTNQLVDGKMVISSDTTNAKAKLVAIAVVDATTGKRVFTDEEAVALGCKNAGPINRLYRRIREISGMTKDTEAAIEKNSETGQAKNSISTSPVG